jgi:broad specificity phosphatase PhoE
MRQVFLVRHAVRADTEDSQWRLTAARPDDPPLSANGLQQASVVGAYLHAKKVTALFCSPFLRAVQTAQRIHEQTGVRFRVDEGLSEWLRPTWFSAKPQFVSPTDLSQGFSGYDASYRSVIVATYPEPDEQVEVFARVQRFLELLDRAESGNVALVGHGASVHQAVRALCGDVEGIEIPVASVTEVERVDGHWQRQPTVVPHLIGAALPPS